MASLQEAARPIRDEAEDFRGILSKGKQLVLKDSRATDLSEEDKKLLLKELFLSSRRGYSLARAGLISETEYQQMSMVLLFSHLGALFDLPRIWRSLQRSVKLVREPCGTFLELFLQPDWDTDGLFDYTGEGIFNLSMVLMEAQPLLNRYGKIPSREGNQRWEVPLVYIICRMVYDALFEQPNPPTVHELLEKIKELTNKLPRLLSSTEAGIALFLVDLIVSKDRQPEGLSLQFLMEFLEIKRFYCLEVAANASSLSKYDIRARCAELLMNANLDFECNKLFGSFCHTLYLNELEKHQGWITPVTSKDSLRSRLLDPAYVLHTYIDNLLHVHNVQYAIIVAADMEKKEWLPLDTREDAYRRVVDYFFQTGTLFYRTHTTWVTSHANAYVPLAGPLGFEVLVQTLHQLLDFFPENHFSEDERRYVSVIGHKTVLSLLVLKYGDRAGASKFASYWEAMPVLSQEKQIEWARNFLERDDLIPESFKQMKGEDGVLRPDLAGSLLDRLRAREQPDSLIEINDEDKNVAVEDMDIDNERAREQPDSLIEINDEDKNVAVEDMDIDNDKEVVVEEEVVVDGDDIEFVNKEEVVRNVNEVVHEKDIDEGEPVHKNDIWSEEFDYSESTSEEELYTSSEEAVDEKNVEDQDAAVVDDQMVLEDSVEAGIVVVDDEFAEADEDKEPVGADMIEVPTNDDALGSSQVETGYDAGESQGHSATDEEERALPYFGSGLDSQHDGILESFESGRVVVPEVFHNASFQLDPGYDAEDSQGPTDAEELQRTTETRGFETGYEAEGSQEQTDDDDEEEEEEEELPSEDSHTEDAEEEVRRQAAYALLAAAAQKNAKNMVRQTENQSLSDMSAADELTTGHDEDLGAESSELEGSLDIRNDAAPAHTVQSSPFEGTSPSLLVRYASAAQLEDDARRASLQQATVVATDNQGFTVATDMSVADSASQKSASIDSGECDVEEIQREDEVVDHVPRDLGMQDGDEMENDLGDGASGLSGDADLQESLSLKAPGDGRLGTAKAPTTGDLENNITDNEIAKSVGGEAALPESVTRAQAGPESSLPLSSSEPIDTAGDEGTTQVDLEIVAEASLAQSASISELMDVAGTAETHTDAEVGAESSLRPSSSEAPARSIQPSPFEGTSPSLLVHHASAAQQREDDARRASLQQATVMATDNQGCTVATDMSVADSVSQKSASIDSGECDVDEIQREDEVVDHVPRDLGTQDGDEMENDLGDGASESSGDVHLQESLPLKAPGDGRLGTGKAPTTGDLENKTTDNEIAKSVGDEAVLPESVARAPESSLPLSSSERMDIAGTGAGTSQADAKVSTESLPLSLSSQEIYVAGSEAGTGAEASVPQSRSEPVSTTGTEMGILRASAESSLPQSSIEHVRFAVDEGLQHLEETETASFGEVGDEGKGGAGRRAADATDHATREEEAHDLLHKEQNVQSPTRASQEEHQEHGRECPKEHVDAIRDSLGSTLTRSGKEVHVSKFSPGTNSAVSSVTGTTRGTVQANSRLPSPSTSHKETPTSSARKRPYTKIVWENESRSDDESRANEKLNFTSVAAFSKDVQDDSSEEEGAPSKRRRVIATSIENQADKSIADTSQVEENRPRRRTRANSASSYSSSEGTPCKKARLSDPSLSILEPINESKTLQPVNKSDAHEESSADGGSRGEDKQTTPSRPLKTKTDDSQPEDDDMDSVASRVRSRHATPNKSEGAKAAVTTAKKTLSGRPPLPKSRPSSKKKTRQRAADGPDQDSVLLPRQTRSSSRHVAARDGEREDGSISSASSGLRRSARFQKAKTEEDKSVASTVQSRGSVRSNDSHSTPTGLRRSARNQKAFDEDEESVASSVPSRSSLPPKTAKKKNKDRDVDNDSTASTPLRRSPRNKKSKTEIHEESTATRALGSRQNKEDAKESDDDNASTPSAVVRRSTRLRKVKTDEGSVSSAMTSRSSSRHKKQEEEIESDAASSNPSYGLSTRSTTRKKQTQAESAPSSPASTRSLRSRSKQQADRSPSAIRRSTRSGGSHSSK